MGPGTRFLSGITYYTYGLAGALAEDRDVSVLLMRRLLPRRLYPGAARVGSALADLALPRRVAKFDGVDWYWLPSLVGAVRFLRRRRPSIVVFQWWSGSVLHSYLALALACRRLGIPYVIEFHEALDTGEDARPYVGRYVNALAPRLFDGADAYVVHSDFDRELVTRRFGIDPGAVHLVPHATYTHYKAGARSRVAPEGVTNLLYFGVIRPFKGVSELVRAFDAIPEGEIDRYWLTIVGETWEDCHEPAELIAASRYRERITFVNRYVTDNEADAIFGAADVVVLPYHRSSQSGPLHMAFAYGLPVVTTAVGGLVEAVADYGGAVLVEPRDPQALLAGIRRAAAMTGITFDHPSTWGAARARYAAVLGDARVAEATAA